MLLERNQLPEPEAIQRPGFDELVQQFKADYLVRIREDNPALADQVERTLEQPGELFYFHRSRCKLRNELVLYRTSKMASLKS